MGHSSRSSSTSKKPFQTFKTFTPSQLTTSTTRMKYAFAILVIACAVAVANACVEVDDAKEGFDYIDTNHNGQISKKELVTALKALAKHMDYKPTKADWAWVAKQATADAATSGPKNSMNQKEFHNFAIEFAKHFDLCQYLN